MTADKRSVVLAVLFQKWPRSDLHASGDVIVFTLSQPFRDARAWLASKIISEHRAKNNWYNKKKKKKKKKKTAIDNAYDNNTETALFMLFRVPTKKVEQRQKISK